MRKFLLAHFLVVISLIFITSINAKIDPKTVAGAWLLDEEKGDNEFAEDISGNENHGTLKGDPEWVDDGIFGDALSFDGATAHVAIPDTDSLDLEEAWTISAWAFVNKSEVSYGHILGKRSGTTNYCFRTSANGQGWEAYFARGGWQGLWGAGTVNKDEWHYMTATYDGENTMTIYEDAVQIGTAGVGGPPPVGTTEVNIGGWLANASERMDGILDEVILLGVALEVEDIEDLMDNGIESALGLAPVEPSGKLASTWGRIRADNR